MEHSSGAISRRTLLFAGAIGTAALLSACAPEPGGGHDLRRRPARPNGDAHGPAHDAPAESGQAATPTDQFAPPAAMADPQQVVAQFTGVAPSRWGMAMPGIVSALAATHDADGRPLIALTLDACGGPAGSGVDQVLIDGLRATQTPATLFLNHRWVTQHAALAAELARDPLFELANHGTRHLPLSVSGNSAYGIAGTVSAQDAVDEVWGNHVALAELTGTPPRLFRSGTAHYDDVGVRITQALGETPIGFTVNGDAGATFDAATVHRQVVTAPAGAIVIAHMNQPQSGTAAGLLQAVAELQSGGTRFTHLAA